MIEVPGVTSESVCSVGGPFADRTCRTGWAETVSGTASLWACLIESSRTAHFACSISSSPSAILESHWRCLFNSEALAEQYQSYLVTSAKATALFPAVCRAPQKTVVLHKCSKTLSVTTDGSCLIGSETTVTARGDAQLGTDSCTGGDTLTITHQCAAGESNDSSRVLYVSLNGFGTAKIRGLKSVSMSAGACSAAVQVLEHSCTGTDKTACTARVRARIYAGSLHSGEHRRHNRLSGMEARSRAHRHLDGRLCGAHRRAAMTIEVFSRPPRDPQLSSGSSRAVKSSPHWFGLPILLWALLSPFRPGA